MITVIFNWSPPALEGWADSHPDGPHLPRQVDMAQVPAAGEYLDFGDDFAGTVQHVTWDLTTGEAYVHVKGIA